MGTALKPCHCGYKGALAGTRRQWFYVLSCPECRRSVEAFTLEGLADAWNRAPDHDKQIGEVKP